MTRSFDRLSVWLARRLGHPVTFVGTLAAVLAAVAASLVPAWRETVNTTAGAVTGYLGILLLLVLQNSQNREGAAVQLKLDEIVRVTDAARNELIAAEDRSVEEIAALREIT